MARPRSFSTYRGLELEGWGSQPRLLKHLFFPFLSPRITHTLLSPRITHTRQLLLNYTLAGIAYTFVLELVIVVIHHNKLERVNCECS